MRRTRWTIRGDGAYEGMGGFAEALLKLIEPRNKTPLEELIAELGYRHARAKSSESVLYIEAQRPQWA